MCLSHPVVFALLSSPSNHIGSGKAYYLPSERDPKARVISVNDEVLDYRLHRQLFTVAGPRDRVIIRKNYPETWLWDAAITGYTKFYQM